jgi:hypothetical protein
LQVCNHSTTEEFMEDKMGLKDRLTRESPVRHLVRYNYYGSPVTEEFGSIGQAREVADKLRKNPDYKNVRVDVTTKHK